MVRNIGAIVVVAILVGAGGATAAPVSRGRRSWTTASPARTSRTRASPSRISGARCAGRTGDRGCLVHKVRKVHKVSRVPKAHKDRRDPRERPGQPGRPRSPSVLSTRTRAPLSPRAIQASAPWEGEASMVSSRCARHSIGSRTARPRRRCSAGSAPRDSNSRHEPQTLPDLWSVERGLALPRPPSPPLLARRVARTRTSMDEDPRADAERLRRPLLELRSAGNPGPSHRLAIGRGSDDFSNTAALCDECHRQQHRHPRT